jgi:hypothetical protein
MTQQPEFGHLLTRLKALAFAGTLPLGTPLDIGRKLKLVHDHDAATSGF